MRTFATLQSSMLALALLGCNPLQPSQQASTDTANASPDARLCEGLTTASESGNTSLRAAFVSTQDGRDYGGGVINELTKEGKYQFLGGEMVGKTCYANAEARGEQWGKMFNLAWRCPVKVLSDNPAEAGKTVLQVVEDRECDFDTERGAPAKREVEVEMIHQ
jgi:hypothetical protein